MAQKKKNRLSIKAKGMHTSRSYSPGSVTAYRKGMSKKRFDQSMTAVDEAIRKRDGLSLPSPRRKKKKSKK